MIQWRTIPKKILENILSHKVDDISKVTDADKERWLTYSSRTELLEAWLEWNGIIGYTGLIKQVVQALEDADTASEINRLRIQIQEQALGIEQLNIDNNALSLTIGNLRNELSDCRETLSTLKGEY